MLHPMLDRFIDALLLLLTQGGEQMPQLFVHVFGPLDEFGDFGAHTVAIALP
jgi:hypothetical protein